MGKIYENFIELEYDYKLFKAVNVYELLNQSFELEKEYARQTGEYDEEELAEATDNFNENLAIQLDEVEPMKDKEEQKMLYDLFNFEIQVEHDLTPIEFYHEENFSKERMINQRIQDFYFETALHFLYMKSNFISETIREPAEKLFKVLEVFRDDNFFIETQKEEA